MSVHPARGVTVVRVLGLLMMAVSMAAGFKVLFVVSGLVTLVGGSRTVRRWYRAHRLATVTVFAVVVMAILATVWAANRSDRPHVEFVSTDGVITYGNEVAGTCWDLYRWRILMWDKVGSGDWSDVSSGQWRRPKESISDVFAYSRSCNAVAIGGTQPLKARLPADAEPGVYRICEWDDCRDFEYRPGP